MKREKIAWIGFLLVALGLVFYVAERVFYGGVDDNGVLQESFFLPLSFILGILGTLLLLVAGSLALAGFFRRR